MKKSNLVFRSMAPDLHGIIIPEIQDDSRHLGRKSPMTGKASSGNKTPGFLPDLMTWTSLAQVRHMFVLFPDSDAAKSLYAHWNQASGHVVHGYIPSDPDGVSLPDGTEITGGFPKLGKITRHHAIVWLGKPDVAFIGACVHLGAHILLLENAQSDPGHIRIIGAEAELISVGYSKEENAHNRRLFFLEINEKLRPYSGGEVLERLTDQKPPPSNPVTLRRRVWWAAGYSFAILLLLILGHYLLQIYPLKNVDGVSGTFLESLDPNFALYMLGGFIAQMIDGSLGMAYGVTITTFLMSLGLPGITPAVASASMHASEVFTTGTGALVYLRFRNVNKKLFRALLLPGVLGAIAGATTISFAGKQHFDWIRPLVACYTGILGVLIVMKAVKLQRKRSRKVKNIGVIAAAGGFLDSVGGGGWGPIVTTSLIAGGRDLRYSVGSSHLAKFFIAVVSSITFFAIIGLGHWQVVFGLVAGGMIIAPVSIFLSNKIPTRAGLVMVGSLVLLVSLRLILKMFIPSIP